MRRLARVAVPLAGRRERLRGKRPRGSVPGDVRGRFAGRAGDVPGTPPVKPSAKPPGTLLGTLPGTYAKPGNLGSTNGGAYAYGSYAYCAGGA